ncbi:MAG: TolC family protein [Gammaproteobacteria bacterium]
MFRRLLRSFALCSLVWLTAAAGGDAEPNVLSLQDAISQALLSNHQYRSLVNGVAVAELDYEMARSVFKTKLRGNMNSDARSGADIGSTYNLGLSKRNESGSGYGVGLYYSQFGSKELSELRFSYTLPFFRNPLTSGKFDSDRAELDFRHRERMTKIGGEELVLRVISAYYRMSLAGGQADLAAGEVTVARKLQQATRIRAKTGRSSEMDLQWADLRVDQARQRREMGKFQRAKAENDLKLVLGLELDAPIAIDEDIPPVSNPEWLLMSATEVEALAMENRAELIGLGEDLDLARRKLRASPARRMPGFDVSLQYSMIGEGSTFADALQFDDSRIGIGVSMDVDLMGNPDQQYRRLALFYDDKRRSYARLEGEIRASVKDAVFAMHDGAGQLRLARQTLQLAEKQFRLTELKYRAGSAGTQDVLEAEQARSDARHAEMTARVDFLLSTYRVRLVAGTLMEDWEIDDPLVMQ